MAKNLHKAGLLAAVWNRTPARAQALGAEHILDGERNALEPAHELGDDIGVRVRERERGVERAHAIDEQLHRFRAPDLHARTGQGQRRQIESHLVS